VWWVGIFFWTATGASAGSDADPWAGYLDYAYIYASAEPEPLGARLEEYARDAGIPLAQVLAQSAASSGAAQEGFDETKLRRRAVGHLLQYLAGGHAGDLEASVAAIRSLEGRLRRHENRYWYRYILAHQALAHGHRHDFVGEVLNLWREVIVPLEGPYETLQTLSLEAAPNAGFAAALPYLYENVARLILLRSRTLGVDEGLDPLGAVVRMLHDGRLGAHPEVVPAEASSLDYLDRIVLRLEGPESDAGSLTFTLALFDASKQHERARGLLARDGLGEETLSALREAAAAYDSAFERTHTVQGRCAVYRRVLRLLGEVHAAKQRLGVDPELAIPFTVDGAIEVYESMQAAREEGWEALGYARHGREAYLEAMAGLWEEIQEAALTLADHQLARGLAEPERVDEHVRQAVDLYAGYLSLFRRHTRFEAREGVPDSAYFAAHEAARGIGDAFLLHARQPRAHEVDLAVRQYRGALRIFPFDRALWSSLAAALERQGRESEYMALALPAAQAVVRSEAVERWIEQGSPEAERIARLRRSFSDGHALVYLGFAEGWEVGELSERVEELRVERDAMRRRLREIEDAAPASLASMPVDAAERAAWQREAALAGTRVERLSRQIQARTRTLPLYEEALGTDGLAVALRMRRDHPFHELVRRMYHEVQEPELVAGEALARGGSQ
jgi:hypothetical protein